MSIDEHVEVNDLPIMWWAKSQAKIKVKVIYKIVTDVRATPRESCIEKPLATLWRNYQQSTKPDVVMKLSVTNSGLKGFTKEHGLTEYWSHRITYCASPPHYPKLFCWVYRHEGKKLKHELRCHAVLCTKESVSKKITEELQFKLKQALVEFKKDRISKQNARLSLANSVYENPSMPRRKILLSVGATNYRPPLERSKSAPKLGAIEELWSEEDEEEAEMNAKQNSCNLTSENFGITQSLDRRRQESKSPRKLSCPDGFINRMQQESASNLHATDELIDLLVKDSQLKAANNNRDEASQNETEKSETTIQLLGAISETHENMDNAISVDDVRKKLLTQSNFLVTDSDDGSVSSGCETASTVTSSDAEPTSLPSHFPHEEIKEIDSDEDRSSVFERVQVFKRASFIDTKIDYTNSIQVINGEEESLESIPSEEVNHVPIGERNGFRRRSTYPPLRTDSTAITDLEGKFESLLDNLTDMDSLNSITETEVYNNMNKNASDNDSACSDESGYSEFLDNGKDSIIGNTIMV
ncbi:Protein FAM43A [Papilio machaon]|uniref:Protein FAM43A n=1 Tax=Papilio machaon TaxID=76193 RepID=A0A194QMR3_PAPMA|nr:Protein FAM43A [Papilio machaon]